MLRQVLVLSLASERRGSCDMDVREYIPVFRVTLLCALERFDSAMVDRLGEPTALRGIEWKVVGRIEMTLGLAFIMAD